MKKTKTNFYHKWWFWLIISVVVLLLVLILLLTLLPEEKCGTFNTGMGTVQQECTCVGVKDTKGMIGGGTIYCKGICLESTCEDVVRRYLYSSEAKSYLSTQEVTIDFDHQQKVGYEIKNDEDKDITLTVRISCIQSKDSSNCSIINYEQKQILKAGKTTLGFFTIGVKKGILKPQTYLWRVEFIKEDGSVYDYKDFFVILGQ